MRQALWRSSIPYTVGALLFVAAARADVDQSFVSGTGDDANPCTRSSPCKTLARAFAVTAPGGAIDALDVGNFGALTITHSVSIEGHGLGEILASGTNGVTISAGAADTVILRGLVIEGLGSPGADGILVEKVKSLLVEQCEIRNFGGVGVSIGTLANPANVPLAVTLDHVEIIGNGAGGFLLATAEKAGAGTPRAAKTYNSSHSNTANIVDSKIENNGGFGGIGVSDATTVQDSFLHSLAFVRDSTVSANSGSGLVARGSGAVITMSNLDVHANNVGLTALGGGQLVSYGNNQILDNMSDGRPTAKTSQQ